MTPQLIELGKIAVWLLVFTGAAIAIGYAVAPLLRVKGKENPMKLIQMIVKEIHGPPYPGRVEHIRTLIDRLAKVMLYDK